MTKKLNAPVSWFVQSYYKPYAATAVLSESIIDPSQKSMPVSKVVLHGLKPSEISYITNDKPSEMSSQCHQQDSLSTRTTTPSSNHQAECRISPETDYLNLHIKPMAIAKNSRSTSSADTAHESTPIRIMISQTSRGRRRINVSQSLLRRHHVDV